MKKLLMFAVIGLFVFSMVSAVSAKTDIVGIVYNEDYSKPIVNANVTVNCNGNIKNTLSGGSGEYGVEYYVSECGNGDTVIVVAEKDGKFSEPHAPKTVQNLGLTVYIAIININMVPEFGFIFGVMTLLSAISIFFVVRKN